jgi:hypothetical protein
MNTANGYADTRMDLNEVCQWLNDKGYGGLSEAMMDAFKYHTWTKDGMLRIDIIKEVCDTVYGTVDLFRAMQCDVTTHMNIIPFHEAHID